MLRHIWYTAIGYGGQIVLSLMTGVIAARLLGPDARGELAALLLLPLTLQFLAMAGFPQAQVVFVARHPKQAVVITSSLFLMTLLTSFIAVVVGLILLPWLLVDMSVAHKWHAALLLAILLPVLTVYGIPSNTFIGLKKYGVFHSYRLLALILYMLAVLSAFWIPDAVVIGWVYAGLVVAIGLPFSYILFRRAFPGELGWKSSLVKPMLRFARVTLLSQFPQIMGQRIDQFIVLAALNTTALGYYTIALSIGQMFQSLQQSAGTFLIPYLASSDVDGRHQAYTFGWMLRLTILTSLCGALVLLALIPWLVPLLFGESFLPSVGAAQLLMVMCGLVGIHLAFMDGFRGCDLPKLTVRSEYVSFAIRCVFLLVGVWGIENPEPSHIALIMLVATLPTLAYDAYLYHHHVEPLNVAWLKRTTVDMYLVWQKLQPFVLRIKMKCLNKA